MEWSKFEKAVEKFVDIPVFVENDANIALLAEKWIELAQNPRI